MNKLLEKYWNGETSLQEEQQLRDYFNSDSVAVEHEIYTSLFTTFSEEHQQEQPSFNAFVRIPDESLETDTSAWRSLKGFIATAAAVVVFALIGAYFSTSDNKVYEEPYLGSYESPEEAYQATLSALQMVGTNLNNGKKNLQPLNDLNNKTKQVISLAN